MPLVFLILALGVLASSSQPRGGDGMTALDIRGYDQSHLRGRAALSAGAGTCQLVWSGRDTPLSCALQLPVGATEITMTGEFSRESGRQREKGTMRWRVIDMGPLLRPLRDRTRPMGDRFRAFVKEKAAFEARHQSLFEGFELSTDPPDTAAAIADAERRLGFSLPAEHRHLLTTVGAFNVEGSFVPPAVDTRLSHLAIMDYWGAPQAVFDTLHKATRALLDSSTVLFTQYEGDDLGAVLYRPSGEAACAGGPAYYWLQQDAIDTPVLLKAGDACADHAGAMIHAIAQDGLQRYEDSEPGFILVDRSAPGPMRVELAYEQSGFKFRMWPSWSHFQ